MNHHAYLFSAPSIAESSIPENYKRQSIDVQHIVSDSFGIDEARKLVYQSSQKSVEESVRTFVIVCSRMTNEAQNALLKLFEEPPFGAQFYLVVQNTQSIIPTLRSRVVVAESDEHTHNDVFTSFCALSHAERIALIAEKAKAKESAWMQAVASGASTVASGSGDEHILMSSILIDQYMQSSGASKKMLLEELALSLPVK